MEEHIVPASAKRALPVANFAQPSRNVDKFGVQPTMKVADFGAGSGAYTMELAKAVGAGGRVYAVDVQKDLLRRIKNSAELMGFKNVDVLWSDVEILGSTKIADKIIDLVLISNLLFQLSDKSKPLTEARRILKQNGKLVVIDWSESFGGMGPQKEDVVSKDVAIGLAKSAGLEFVREFEAGAHHYGLIFKAL